MTPVVLQSSMKDDFDLWHVLNSPVMADSVQVKLSEIGAIEKKRANLPIIKRNQSYEINIGFDFIGSYKLAKSYMDETVKHFNDYRIRTRQRKSLEEKDSRPPKVYFSR